MGFLPIVAMGVEMSIGFTSGRALAKRPTTDTTFRRIKRPPHHGCLWCVDYLQSSGYLSTQGYLLSLCD